MEEKMKDFISIDEMQQRLDRIADTIPKEFYNELNLGIILVEQEKIHPKSKNDDLYILGEYQRSHAGRQIIIYYGSVKKAYSKLSDKALDEKLEELLLHEFTHHIEYRAGEKGLEIKDEEQLNRYMQKNTK